MTFLAAFFASLVLIFLKSTQQRHVQFEEYWRMPAVSYGMAGCEVFITAKVAVHAITESGDTAGLVLLAFSIGTGAALGGILGTYLHARRKR